MKYSFIIPAYNVEEHIETTLNSVISTANDETEIIVINDGSTDSTDEIIRRIVDSCDNEIIYINQINQGVSAARNAGIDASSGEYIIFCDGDDICSSELIDELESLDNVDSDIIVWGFDALQSDSGQHLVKQSHFDMIEDGRKLFKSVLMGENRVRLGSFAIKKAIIDEYSINYTVGCPLSQDVEFIYKCLARVNSVRCIDKVLFTYVQHSGSVMYRYNLNRFEAPRTMKRIYEYVKGNTDLFSDNDVEEYLGNGFILQHAMYSFEACIPYLHDGKNRKQFWLDYTSKYLDIDEEIKRIKKDIKIYPKDFKSLKVKLFLFSRKLYVYAMLIK